VSRFGDEISTVSVCCNLVTNYQLPLSLSLSLCCTLVTRYQPSLSVCCALVTRYQLSVSMCCALVTRYQLSLSLSLSLSVSRSGDEISTVSVCCTLVTKKETLQRFIVAYDSYYLLYCDSGACRKQSLYDFLPPSSVNIFSSDPPFSSSLSPYSSANGEDQASRLYKNGRNE